MSVSLKFRNGKIGSRNIWEKGFFRDPISKERLNISNFGKIFLGRNKLSLEKSKKIHYFWNFYNGEKSTKKFTLIAKVTFIVLWKKSFKNWKINAKLCTFKPLVSYRLQFFSKKNYVQKPKNGFSGLIYSSFKSEFKPDILNFKMRKGSRNHVDSWSKLGPVKFHLWVK